MANGPILWGGNSTANNLQSYLTSNSCIGSNSGQRNYLQTWYFFNQNPTTGIVTSLTSTGNRTTNTTFWGSSTTSLLSYVTSSPLRYGAMAQIAVTGASGAQFVETPMFTLDVADIGKTITVSFDYSTSGTFSTGDCTIQIINYNSSGTYQQTITPSITSLPSALSFFQTSFTGSATATDQYSIRFLSNNASLRTFNIDSIYVGPGQLAIGTPISAPIAFTPTFTGFGSVTSITAFYTRVGNWMLLDVGFVCGTNTASLASVSLPTALTLDTTKVVFGTSTGSANAVVGAYGAGTLSAAGIILAAPGTSTSVLYFGNTPASNGSVIAQNGTTVAASSALLSFQARIPIAQWSTQTTLGTSSTEFVYNTNTAVTGNDTTSFGYGAAGIAIPNFTQTSTTYSRRVQFSTMIQPTDNIQVEINISSEWIPATGYYPSAYGASGIAFGVSWIPVTGSTNQIDVRFGGNGTRSTNGLAANGDAWNTNNALWRVRKSSGIGVGELAPATISSAGYVNGQSGWVAYTPTLVGVGTPTSVVGFYRRVGDSLDLKVSFIAGTPTATMFQVPFPNGYVSDTNKTGRSVVGLILNNNGASVYYTMSGGGVGYVTAAGGNACETDVNGTTIATSGWVIRLDALGIPIVGWS